MTTTTTHTPLFAAASTAATRQMALVARLVQVIGNWRTSRKQFGKLKALDDRMLADIGLTRSDIRAAEQGELRLDPTVALAERAHARRLGR